MEKLRTCMSTRRKAVVFGVFSKSKIFRPHKFLSFSLAALFKKNKLEEEEEEEEEEEKEEKKASNFQSCRLLLTTHTYKELAQRRRSKTERRRATH